MPVEKDLPPAESRLAINMDCLTKNGRSATSLLSAYLCAACRKRFSGPKHQPSARTMMSAILKCCSQDREFIGHKSSLLETCFRIFLRGGNSPLGLDELATQLAKARAAEISPVPRAALARILKSDTYYGLQEFPY